MRSTTPRHVLQRQRRPGDLLFSIVFLLFSLFLLSQLGEQTVWKKNTQLFAQPAFWPAVSLIGMSLFAVMHWVSSVYSSRIPGRWAEVSFWIQSVEYVVWFMVYVITVPRLGYLPSTILFAVLLVLRTGYRSSRVIFSAAGSAVVIVLVFKTFLQVKVPGGELYEYLPGSLRAFMLTWF